MGGTPSFLGSEVDEEDLDLDEKRDDMVSELKRDSKQEGEKKDDQDTGGVCDRQKDRGEARCGLKGGVGRKPKGRDHRLLWMILIQKSPAK